MFKFLQSNTTGGDRPKAYTVVLVVSSRKHVRVMYTPFEPHFYIAKLGYAGVNLFFLFVFQTIYCGYSLEPPRRGDSKVEILPIYVLSNNKKNIKLFQLKVLNF